MIIFQERKLSNRIKRILLEGSEFTSLEQARNTIFPYLVNTFPRLKASADIITVSKTVIFKLLAPDFELSLWWQGLKYPNEPYNISVSCVSRVYTANTFNDAVNMLRKINQTWCPPESNLNIKQLLAAITGARLSGQRQYKFFGFRGDTRSIRIGQILGASFNGMGDLSTVGNTPNGRLPGTSTIGIPNPVNPKNMALAWRAFSSVNYGKNHSLVGGRSIQLGDDVISVRMDGREYDVDEYVIKGAEVLAVIN